jgi:hypothetical protein
MALGALPGAQRVAVSDYSRTVQKIREQIRVRCARRSKSNASTSRRRPNRGGVFRYRLGSILVLARGAGRNEQLESDSVRSAREGKTLRLPASRSTANKRPTRRSPDRAVRRRRTEWWSLRRRAQNDLRAPAVGDQAAGLSARRQPELSFGRKASFDGNSLGRST